MHGWLDVANVETLMIAWHSVGISAEILLPSSRDSVCGTVSSSQSGWEFAG